MACASPTTSAKRADGAPGESKAAYERIIWQRLVLDFTKLNRGRDFATVRGVYPCPDGGKLERIDRIMSTDSLWRRGYK